MIPVSLHAATGEGGGGDGRVVEGCGSVEARVVDGGLHAAIRKGGRQRRRGGVRMCSSARALAVSLQAFIGEGKG